MTIFVSSWVCSDVSIRTIDFPGIVLRERSCSFCPASSRQLFRKTPCRKPSKLLTSSPFCWLQGLGDWLLSAYGVNPRCLAIGFRIQCAVLSRYQCGYQSSGIKMQVLTQQIHAGTSGISDMLPSGRSRDRYL